MAREQWNFDPTHSEIVFKVRHMMFSKVTGRFEKWSGSLGFDPQNPTDASVQVSIDATTINTGVADRDNHLKSPDFFNTPSFPSIDFQSTGFERAGDGLKVHGNLSMHGNTRPVTLEVDFHGQGTDPWGNTRIGFTAHATLNRKDFGLTWNQALEAGGVLVGENVEVEIQAQAVKA